MLEICEDKLLAIHSSSLQDNTNYCATALGSVIQCAPDFMCISRQIKIPHEDVLKVFKIVHSNWKKE